MADTPKPPRAPTPSRGGNTGNLKQGSRGKAKPLLETEATVVEEDLGWDELVAEILVIEEMQPGVEVGFPAGMGYDTKRPGQRASVLDKAQTNEFGNSREGIPKRAFLRYSFDANAKRWATMLDEAASKQPAPGSGPPLAQALAKVAEDAVQQTKRTIDEWTAPPNAARTIARKGFNDPLFETGEMLHAVAAKFVYEQRPPTAVPQGLKEPRTSTQRRTRRVRVGRKSKGLSGALLASARRWGGLGAETAFRAPGKSASKKSMRVRFRPRRRRLSPRW